MAHFTLELFDPPSTLYLMYFTNIENASQIKANVEKFECAFITPSLLCSVEQIFFASTRALFDKISDHPKTQSIYSDIIYYLSPNTSVIKTQISESFLQYGIQDNSSEIIIASFSPETLETVRTAIDGEVTEIEKYCEKIQHNKIKQLFKIKDSELALDRSLINSVLAVLAIKDVGFKQKYT